MVVRILGISGSGRKGSYNSALLAAAQEELPEDAVMETFDVYRLPMFQQDNELDPPPAARELKRKIKEADAILFATPEYNFSVSAALKNAIEWGNRPEEDNSWEGKPAAIVSASTGPRGGARAQLHLRQIMVDLDMHPLNSPQLYLGRARGAFDENMRLVDEAYRKTLKALLGALVEWAVKLKGS